MNVKTESQTTLTSGRSMTEIRNPPWWHRRTRMERLLTLLVVGVGALAIAALVGLATIVVYNRDFLFEDTDFILIDKRSVPPARGKPRDLCTTEACVTTAASLLTNMNTSADPCEDFYEFACGGFIKKNIIPDDKTSISQFSVIDDELKIKLRILVEEPQKDSEPMALKMVKYLYQSCLNKTKVEELGLKPLRDVLEQMGGWPVVQGSNWDATSFSWFKSIYTNRELGYSVDLFFDFSVTTDIKNSTWRIIDIDQASLFLPRKYLIKGFDDKDVKAYYTYMVKMAVLLGANESDAMAEMKDALEFEITLANYCLPAEERRNASKLYNKMLIGDLKNLAPQVPWLDYINTLLRPVNLQVDNNEPVIVDVPDFLKKTGILIDATPARTLANYIMWRVVGSSVSMLTENARNIQQEYSAKLTGQQIRKPRWEECLGTAKGNLGNAIGSMYVRRHFKQKAREDALTMMKNIHKEFDKILMDIEWMDEVTRERAQRKSQAIKYYIAYPPELLNDTLLEDLYEGLTLDNVHYFANILNISVYGTNYAFRRLREMIDKTDWKRHGRAAVVNAYYSPIENSIQFPAGILQGAFYGPGRPHYMNYGAIGFIIGHEITHGFDDTGRQFDENGDLSDWWQTSTKEKFLKKAQCIIDQYGNITVPEVNINLNGKLTQGENIADNGGLKEAYYSYLALAKDMREQELPLPGLDYTPAQMFWLSAANVWCMKRRPESVTKLILTDTHSPGRYRVNVPISNLLEFSRDFNCKPACHRCTVW